MSMPLEFLLPSFWKEDSAEGDFGSPLSSEGRKNSNSDANTPDTETSTESATRAIEPDDSKGLVRPRGKSNFRHRRSHVKSKNGCFSCKDRRVKCDEHQPACQNCMRRDINCEYPPPPTAPEIVFTQPFVPDGAKSSRKDYARTNSITTIERAINPVNVFSREKTPTEYRLARTASIPLQVAMPDLRLMQNFTTQASSTLVLGTESDIWRTGIARMGFNHDFLMHTILMFSAGHLAKNEPVDMAHKIHELDHRQQAIVSLRETLGKTGITVKNFDAVLGASILLAFHSCASFNEEDPEFSTDGYIPLMNGVRLIAKEIWPQRDQSLFAQLLAMPLAMQPDDELLFGLGELYKESYVPKPIPIGCEAPYFSEDGLPLKRISLDDLELDDATIYRSVWGTLNPCMKAIMMTPKPIPKDRRYTMSCALLAWPALQPDKFVAMSKRCDKKSLVILAYYYATLYLLNLEETWWMRGRPRAMCRSLVKVLGPEYRQWLAWPIETCQLDDI